MIITRLSASFGALKNDELTLREGLNVVEAPNETGKSTWCAFIRAMLYGIDTADRDRAGYISAKNRYRPWSGAPMEGELDAVWKGEKITLRRKGQGGAPMRSFSAVYAGTREPVPGLADKAAGEALTGVSEPIFERSAFIRQSALAVNQTAELEKRIAALVSGGDEAVSYTQVSALLKEWMNRRQYRQRGLLPACEGELREVRGRIEEIEQKTAALADARLELERMEKFRDEFVRENEAVERYEKYAEYLAASEAAGELREKERELKEHMDALRGFPRFPTRENIAAVREGAEALAREEALRREAEKRRDARKKAFDAIEEARAGSRFYPGEPAEAEARANQASTAYIEAGGGEEPGRRLTLTPPVLGCFAAALALAVLGIARSAGWWVYALAAVCAAAGAALLLRLRPPAQRQADEQERREILGQLGAASIAELNALVREYKELCIRAGAARDELDAGERELAAAEAARDAAKAALLETLALIDPEAPAERAGEAAGRAEAALDEAQLAKIRLDGARKVAEARGAASVPDVWAGKIPPAPKYSRAEAQSSLKYAERQLAGISSSLSMALGELKTLGDPVVLRTRAAELTARLQELRQQYGALALASDVLAESNAEIQSRFAPRLSERAGQIMAELTGGKYDSVSFDRNLSAEARGAGDSVSHDMLYLSEGTADQLYLALRLAVCELLLPGDEPCPIILDDALTNFDDRRMALALDFLRREGEKRQVVLFTCHGRESAYLDGRRGVNIVRLGQQT